MTADYLDNKKYKKMLGVYIKEQRERLQLTPLELSKKSHITPTRLKKIEAGETLIRNKTLESLKRNLALDEAHIAKIQDVAKVAFIDDLFQLINSEKETEDESYQ